MNETQKIGRYLVQSLLGEGAMGSVFRAVDPNIGRTVAIKIVKIDRAQGSDEDTTEFQDRFQQEARISGNLNHPNIVAVYDVAEHDGMPYIAMEFVEGMTLSGYIKSIGRRSSVTIVKLLCQLAGALDFAHAQGIVHRDLKPANIMVTAEGVPKIMDFGIAKQTGTNLTVTGVFLGTPSYSSPEQVKEGHVDHRSDIFSLGILACEALTGKLPFPGKSINAILYKIANEAPVFEPDTDYLNMPLARFREIFTKALHKDPEKRYQSATAFTSALLEAMELTQSDRRKLDQTIHNIQATVAVGGGVAKKLARSDFEAESGSLDQTVLTGAHPRGTRRAPWAAAMILIPLVLLGGGFYLYQSGKLEALLNRTGAAPATGTEQTAPEAPKPDAGTTTPVPLVKQLTVQSTPGGASVLLDGSVLGTTPYTHGWNGMTGDTLKLVVHKDGYADHTLELTLSETLTSVQEVTLAAVPVTRTITSRPEGAVVTLDDESLGKAPHEVALLPGRRYRLRATLDGYRDKSLTYTEGESDPDVLALAMVPKPPPGSLKVTSLLDDLRLTVDGKAAKGTTLSLDPGSYRIGLSSARYFYEETREVTIESKETVSWETPIVLHIPKVEYIGGYVHVRIDGRYVTRGEERDTTPLVNLSLTAGSHEFEFVDPDGKIVHRKTIEVTRSEDIVVSADR